MKPNTDLPQLRIDQQGETAHRLLTPGQCGKVVAVFSKVAYLILEPAELLWLGVGNTPMHPRCLQISDSLPKVAAGAPFAVEDSCIHLAPSFRLDFSQVVIWHAPQLTNHEVLEIAEIPDRVKTVFSSLLDFQAPKGFGQFLPGILTLYENRTIRREPEWKGPIVSPAWPTVHDIAYACRVGETAHLGQKADALVGLGEGLTPSGDDFLGGFLFSLHHLRKLYPVFSNIPDSTSWIERLRNRTHLISFTILKDLADGRGVDPLHQFIERILTCGSPDNAYEPISRLIQIGHSTGWDLLTGALTGLLLTVSNPEDQADWIETTSFPTRRNVPV